MAFKFEIGDPKSKKTFHLEAESEAVVGRLIGEAIKGDEISSQLSGVEFEITGTSDKAGFPGFKKVEGSALKRVLLSKGKGMHNKTKGLRLRKTVRGNAISSDTVQINLKVTKQGDKSIAALLGKEEKPAEVPAEPKTA